MVGIISFAAHKNSAAFQWWFPWNSKISTTLRAYLFHRILPKLNDKCRKQEWRFFRPLIKTWLSLHLSSLNSLMETVQIFSIRKILFSLMSYTTVMKHRFVVTHTVRHTESPVSPDSPITNTPSVKMLCP